MPKKANKKRKKPAPRPAPAPVKKKTNKSKKPLIIAICAAAAVCAAFVILLLAGVFSCGGGLDGTWEQSEFGYMLIIDGDVAFNEDGERIALETEGDMLTMTYENGERYEYVYVLDGDTLAIFETSDAERSSPLVVFTRTGGASLPESSSEPSSSEPSSSEPSSSEPSSSAPQPDETDDGIPDFEKLGIAEGLMEVGGTYPYTTLDYSSEDGALVKGTLRVVDYEITPLTEKAKKFAEDMGVDLTGYESRTVTVRAELDSITADVAYLSADYYHAKLFEDNFNPIGVSEDGTQYATSKIRYNGAEMTAYMLGDAGFYEDDTVYKTTDVWEVIVPEGYDGVCIGYYNTALLDSIPDGVDKVYSYDYYKEGEMLYFRCA